MFSCFADPRVISDQRLGEIERLDLSFSSPLGRRLVRDELAQSVRLLKSERTRQDEEITRLKEQLTEHESHKLIPLFQ